MDMLAWLQALIDGSPVPGEGVPQVNPLDVIQG